MSSASRSCPSADPTDSAPILSTPLEEIAAERRRQVEVEGWAPELDDKHHGFQLSAAAACYALGYRPSSAWPWHNRWWKPTSRRRDLVKAGALIVAEIERLDRLSDGPEEGQDGQLRDANK